MSEIRVPATIRFVICKFCCAHKRSLRDHVIQETRNINEELDKNNFGSLYEAGFLLVGRLEAQVDLIRYQNSWWLHGETLASHLEPSVWAHP